jgi:MFS family permease
MTSLARTRKLPLVISGILLAELAAALEITMIFSALPSLMKTFGATGNVMWIVTVHYLVAASASALCGRLGDMFGRKRIMLYVLGIAATGSLISACSTGLPGMIVGRGMQGIAGACIPLSFGMMRALMPPAQIPLGISLVTMTATVTGSLGLLVGGFLIDHFAWQSIFVVSLAVTVAAFLAVALFVPAVAPAPGQGSLDVVGGLVFVPAAMGLLYGVIEARSWGWTDQRTLAIVGGSFLLFVFWCRYELRRACPLIDLRLLVTRQIGLANICMVLLALGAMQYTLVLPVLMQQPLWTGAGFGISATTAGLMQFPLMLIHLLGAPWSGRLAGRHGARHTTLLGAALLFAAWTVMALKHDALWLVLLMDYVQALGMAILFAAIPNLIVEAAPAQRVSEATGMLSVVRTVALAIASQVIAFTLHTNMVTDPARGSASYPAASGYVVTFAVMALWCLLILVAGVFLPKRKAAAGPARTPAPGAESSARG